MKTQIAKHTPTPWKYHLGRGIDPRIHIQTIGGYQIAQTPKNGVSCGNEAINGANAEFICRAVNEHDTLIAQRDALLEACKTAYVTLSKIPAFGDTIGDKVNKPQIGVAHNQLKVAIEMCHQLFDDCIECKTLERPHCIH